MKYDNTIAALAQFGERIKDQMIENLFNNRSVDTGTLAKSITDTVSEQNLSATVAVNEWYGITLEEGIGRKAGRMPPLTPIKNWIRKRNLRPKPGSTIDSFAFAIAKKIAKQGTNPKARPFAAPAVQQVQQNFGNNALAQAYGKDLENNLTEIFEESTK